MELLALRAVFSQEEATIRILHQCTASRYCFRKTIFNAMPHTSVFRCALIFLLIYTDMHTTHRCGFNLYAAPATSPLALLLSLHPPPLRNSVPELACCLFRQPIYIHPPPSQIGKSMIP